MSLLRDQDWKVRNRRRCKFKLTSTSHRQTARMRSYTLRRISRCFPSPSRYDRDHMIFNFPFPSLRIWLACQSMCCCVALSIQNKRTTRNMHHYFRERHGHKFMPACSLITKDYNCLLEIACTPSTALRALATHVVALSQEAKLAASAIVGQQSSPSHAVPIART